MKGGCEMKIKTVSMSIDEALKEASTEYSHPKKPNILFRSLLCLLSIPETLAVRFKCKKTDMKRLKKNEPCLYLMNHSSFTDLKIASTLLYPRPFNIVCTKDALVGKKWLMRQLGCTPTSKFVFDMALVKNMVYCVKTLKSSVLMYPEAGYTFDGTATTLPDSLGKCVKLLNVPLVMIRADGAFLRDPLYNGLRKRKVRVSGEMKYLLSADEIKEKSVEEINEIIKNEFSFDGFKWQQENKISISEPFRAEGLNRVLYKCPACLTEGMTEGKDTRLICKHCGKEYVLTEYGYMRSMLSETEFEHIPDWYLWQRECVKQDILNGKYNLDIDVSIYVLSNAKHLISVGNGRLLHNKGGFVLSDCEGKILYTQKPSYSYSLNSDFYWYEMGDVIGLGDKTALYYCFPLDGGDIVAKTRLAAEEMYKLDKEGLL